MMAAEVLDKPLRKADFCGFTQEEIHEMSHHIQETFSFSDTNPQDTMDEIALQLNWLRTQARETEIVAINAFLLHDTCMRADILQGLNRLSSAVYVLYCRVLSGYYCKSC